MKWVLSSLIVLIPLTIFMIVDQKNLVPIRVGINSTIKSGNIIIAHQLGYFKKVGLDVQLEVSTTGVKNFEKILNNDLDISNVPDSVLVSHQLAGKDGISLLGVSNSSNTYAIVARIDRGITAVKNLKGRRVGVHMRSHALYWLDSFLLESGILINEVELVDIKPKEGVAALKMGRVDAIASWFPYVHQAHVSLGANGTFLEMTRPFRTNWNVVARHRWVKNNKDIIESFFKAVDRANEYIKENENEAKAILSNSLQLSRDSIDIEWERHHFKLEVGRNTILQLESLARWYGRKRDVDQSRLNFMSMIVADPIRNVISGGLNDD